MIFLDPIQVGEQGDAGPRDQEGNKHGDWIWEEPIVYRQTAKPEEFHTKVRMSVHYDHGNLIIAKLIYDISEKYLSAHEYGKAIGQPLKGGNLPFKKGLWRGYKGKDLIQTISFYDKSSIQWEYFKVNGQWGFKTAETQDGMFVSWNHFKPGEFQKPPQDGEWPENFDPFVHIELFEPESWT